MATAFSVDPDFFFHPGDCYFDSVSRVGTSASYIRKVPALLKNAGIAEGHRGVDGIHILDIHQNPSDQCLVGRHIKPVLTDMFADAENPLRSLFPKGRWRIALPLSAKRWRDKWTAHSLNLNLIQFTISFAVMQTFV